MPRDREKVRRRLQKAALELYGLVGYEQATAAQIAERAGVTERTFFRHFPDKREVLFDGQEELSAVLIRAVKDSPATLGTWATLRRAFEATDKIMTANGDLAEARRAAIAASPALRERELTKAMALSHALAGALNERGLSYASALLAAQLGMAAFGKAFEAWLDGGGDFRQQVQLVFDEVRTLTA
ncbi:TetR/AcrR family transcriptional regulator [Martelella mediterranea]|uniref:TetR family transcriptional regulator n=1 Tax=Martelella mediterranea TaxID=293089 RepID=A0A4V2V3F2_9HYPH|nr:TetR/AcrR family transcriptional regulator [Martelella mediterranea]TCT32684.1 TetR family transcriptional regulator [Martelella mediterranea]